MWLERSKLIDGVGLERGQLFIERGSDLLEALLF